MTYLDHVSGDVADTASPLLRRLVQNIVHANAGVFLGEGIEVLLEQDVLGSDIGKDQVYLGLITLRAIATAANNGTDDLKHRGDTSTAGNHAKVTNHVGSVDKGTLGAPDADGLTNHEGRHVLRDVALRVGLDEEVEVAGLVVAGDGSIGTDNLLGVAVGLGERSANGDVLADGEAENGVARGQLEPIARGATLVRACKGLPSWHGVLSLHGYIVGDDGLLLELKLLEDIWLQDLPDLYTQGDE